MEEKILKRIFNVVPWINEYFALELEKISDEYYLIHLSSPYLQEEILVPIFVFQNQIYGPAIMKFGDEIMPFTEERFLHLAQVFNNAVALSDVQDVTIPKQDLKQATIQDDISPRLPENTLPVTSPDFTEITGFVYEDDNLGMVTYFSGSRSFFSAKGIDIDEVQPGKMYMIALWPPATFVGPVKVDDVRVEEDKVVVRVNGTWDYIIDPEADKVEVDYNEYVVITPNIVFYPANLIYEDTHVAAIYKDGIVKLVGYYKPLTKKDTMTIEAFHKLLDNIVPKYSDLLIKRLKNKGFLSLDFVMTSFLAKKRLQSMLRDSLDELGVLSEKIEDLPLKSAAVSDLLLDIKSTIGTTNIDLNKILETGEQLARYFAQLWLQLASKKEIDYLDDLQSVMMDLDKVLSDIGTLLSMEA